MWVHDKRSGRLGAVVAATVLAVVVWVVAEPILGVDLRSPAQGGGATRDINGVVIAVAGLVASLAGWALLSLLERFVPRRARLIWVGVAVGVLVLSLGGPLSGDGVTTANRMWLAGMHLCVAAVLIPALARTSRDGHGLDTGAAPAAGHGPGMAATGTREESR